MLRRALRDWLVLAAALLTVLISGTALSSLAAFGATAVEQGTRAALAAAAVLAAAIVVLVVVAAAAEAAAGRRRRLGTVLRLGEM